MRKLPLGILNLLSFVGDGMVNVIIALILCFCSAEAAERRPRINENKIKFKVFEKFLRTGKCNGCNFRGIIFKPSDVKTLRNNNVKIVDLTNADLTNANFSGMGKVNFTGIKIFFDNAELANVDFKGATFGPVSFKNAYLPKANFEEAFLKGADFTLANVEAANFTTASLQDAKFVKANLTLATFDKAHLEHTFFTGAILISASINEAWLFRTNFTEATLNKTDFGVITPSFLTCNFKGISCWPKIWGFSLGLLSDFMKSYTGHMFSVSIPFLGRFGAPIKDIGQLEPYFKFVRTWQSVIGIPQKIKGNLKFINNKILPQLEKGRQVCKKAIAKYRRGPSTLR